MDEKQLKLQLKEAHARLENLALEVRSFTVLVDHAARLLRCEGPAYAKAAIYILEKTQYEMEKYR